MSTGAPSSALQRSGIMIHDILPPPPSKLFSDYCNYISFSFGLLSLDGTFHVWDSIKGGLICQLEHNVAYTGKYPFFAAFKFHQGDQKMVYGSRKALKLCGFRLGKLLVDLLPVDQVQYVYFSGHFCLARVVRDGAHSLEVLDFGDDDDNED
ncbi:hypothetical protein CVT26_007007 [Gymnopilus dilepis]|uniref:Uncharacterized protein n=1 Tax=Gymnopilus dilepis TaxID=231916 RepID=A0A409W043_9AGAR|nr:hypothetical protein CVT26_007007 [Gymnopilus dilepis]